MGKPVSIYDAITAPRGARATVCVVVALALAGCVDKGLAPHPQRAAVHIALDLNWAGQTDPALASLIIRADYRQTDGNRVAIAEQSASAAAGADGVLLELNLGECLADPLRDATGPTCPLYITIVAVNASGLAMDSLVTGPVDASGRTPVSLDFRLGLADTTTIYHGSTAQVAPPIGAPEPAATTYESSDTSIAAVSGSGLVTSRTVGLVSITARSGAHTSVTRVRVAPHPARALSVTNSHGCALSLDGVAHCWGANGSGRLGTGDFNARSTPTQVQTTERFVQISTYEGTSCGLSSRFVVHCWGSNGSGVLGDGTTNPSPVPLAVPAPVEFTSVSVGLSYACGLARNGAAYCWGSGVSGALGNGTTGTPAPSPAPVTGGHVFATLDAGLSFACALTLAGAAYCWGSNQFRSLGIGPTEPTTSFPTPTPVVGGTAFRQISAGASVTCGLDFAGTAYCWGADFNGSLGSGQTGGQVSSPQPVATSETFAMIHAGDANNTFSPVCAVAQTGEAYCWGANSRGQLGTTAALPSLCTGGGLTDVPCTGVPTPVTTSLRFTTVSTGADRSCGLTTDRRLACWGSNTSNKVGDGTDIDRPTPVVIGTGIRWP